MRFARLQWWAERFELARGGKESNLRVMEGMRGLAVLLVFLVHYASLSEPWTDHAGQLRTVLSIVHAIGNTGVDLFFVLSGYLIYGSLIEREQPIARFIKRRYQRIYPVFLAVFVLYLALSFMFPGESKIPSGSYDGSVYLLQNLLLLPGMLPIEPMITVAWSLSYEMFFYILTPFVVWVLGLRAWSARRRVGLFVVSAAVWAVYCGLFGGPVRLIMFLMGMVLFEVVRNRLSVAPSVAIGAVALVAGLETPLLPVAGSAGFALKIGLLAGAFGLFAWSCFVDSRTWLVRALSWTPLRWFGNMSYSYYLLHGLALHAVFMALGMFVEANGARDLLVLCLLPFAFLATLVPTVLLFLLIERPFSLTTRAPAGLRQTATVS